MFLYQTLDAIDGKQARRTGSSNALGELFDHGCDSLSNRNYNLNYIRPINFLTTFLTWPALEQEVNKSIDFLNFSGLINSWSLCDEHGVYRLLFDDGLLLFGARAFLFVPLANICNRYLLFDYFWYA